jgi:UDP-N-acetylmuramoyl-L-alanyl-D-glutamate--2,6-diaminopimelate ligase
LRPHAKRLICILGAAGGGRDKWKRPKFGALAERYCDRIILTNEDPYDEQPLGIVDDIFSGMDSAGQKKVERIMDRADAIRSAVAVAQEGDIVVITGKGSETSIAYAGGVKKTWSDAAQVREALR